MLDESICHFRGVRSILCFYSNSKILFANIVDPDQPPHSVGSDLGLHYLPMTFLQVRMAVPDGIVWQHVYKSKVIVHIIHILVWFQDLLNEQMKQKRNEIDWSTMEINGTDDIKVCRIEKAGGLKVMRVL